MNFYHLRPTDIDNKVSGTDYEKPDDFKCTDPPMCSSCGETMGLMTWLPPFRVSMKFWGNQHGDLAFGAGMDLLISQRFRSLFTDEGLTGLEMLGAAEVIKVTPRKMAGESLSIQLPG